MKTVGVAVCCAVRQGVYDPDALTCLIFDPAKIRVSAVHPRFSHRPNFALILPFPRSFGYFLCPGRFCAVLGLKNAQALCVFRFLIRLVGYLLTPAPISQICPNVISVLCCSCRLKSLGKVGLFFLANISTKDNR